MTAWRRYLRRKERAQARAREALERRERAWAEECHQIEVDAARQASDILLDIPWHPTSAPTFTYQQETPIPGLYRHPDGSWQKREET